MVITMLEGALSSEQAEVVKQEFDRIGEPPPAIVSSYFAHDEGTSTARLVTVWSSKEALDEYRASVEAPGGVLMFKAAGVDPMLSIFEVLAHIP